MFWKYEGHQATSATAIDPRSWFLENLQRSLSVQDCSLKLESIVKVEGKKVWLDEWKLTEKLRKIIKTLWALRKMKLQAKQDQDLWN